MGMVVVPARLGRMSSASYPGATERLISWSTDVGPNGLATPVSLTTGWTMAWPLVAPFFLFAVFLAGAPFTSSPFAAGPFVPWPLVDGPVPPFRPTSCAPAPPPPRPSHPPLRHAFAVLRPT